MVDHLTIAGGVQVVDTERALNLVNTVFRRGDGLALLVDFVVFGNRQTLCNLGKRVVRLGSVFWLAGNDQRRTRLVDQDRVDLIDDREGVAALHGVFELDGEVIAQVVEAELRVGAVRDVAGVGRTALLRLHAGLDNANADAQHLVERTHPLRIATGEVVVDRHEVHAESSQRVETDRQGCDQRLTFARAHLGNRAAMKARATDDLDVKVAHVHGARTRLACERVGLCLERRQHLLHLILGRIFAEAFRRELPEFAVALAQALVRECGGLLGQRSGRVDDLLEFFEALAFADAKETVKQFCHGTNPTSLNLNAALESSPHYRSQA